MKYILVLGFALCSCTAKPQIIEIVDLWEPDWLFDCLEQGIPGEECSPPLEEEFCSAHDRVMIDESR